MQTCIYFVRLKSKTLRNCLYSSSSPYHFSGITGKSNGEFEAKKYFKYRWTANTIQLFVVITKKIFWSTLFHSEGEFPKDYLINAAACFFA